MFFTLVLSSVLILVFELESSAVASGSSSRSQLVAGYFVFLLSCLYLGASYIAVG